MKINEEKGPTHQQENVHGIRSIDVKRLEKGKRKKKKKIRKEWKPLGLAFLGSWLSKISTLATNSSTSFGIQWNRHLDRMRAVVWLGASTWMVLECNSFGIGFGFPRDCFDLGWIVFAASKVGLVPPLPASLVRRKLPPTNSKLSFEFLSTIEETSRCFPLLYLSMWRENVERGKE